MIRDSYWYLHFVTIVADEFREHGKGSALRPVKCNARSATVDDAYSASHIEICWPKASCDSSHCIPARKIATAGPNFSVERGYGYMILPSNIVQRVGVTWAKCGKKLSMTRELKSASRTRFGRKWQFRVKIHAELLRRRPVVQPARLNGTQRGGYSDCSTCTRRRLRGLPGILRTHSNASLTAALDLRIRVNRLSDDVPPRLRDDDDVAIETKLIVSLLDSVRAVGGRRRFAG